MIFGLLLIALFVRILNRRVLNQINNNQLRYRVCKVVQASAYAAGGLFVLSTLAQRPEVFSA
jgi:hypothetical protein